MSSAGRLRLQWPWAACLVALVLVAAPGKSHAVLMEGSYNITGSCTANSCTGGPLSFSGMFDIDSSGLVQNFMMSFDVPDALIFLNVSLVTAPGGTTQFFGEISAGTGSIQFSPVETWDCISITG